MAKYILGIDQGTTGTKVILFDRSANIVSSAYSEFTQYFPQPGWVEHDPLEIWDVTMKMVKECISQAGAGLDEIAAIGITNQRETSFFWDKVTGEPANRAQVWQDRRALSICEELNAKDRVGIEERTGMIVIPNCICVKLAWMLRNIPEVQQGVQDGRLIFGTIDTWLVWKLTGGQRHVTDPSNLTTGAMLNATTLDYDEWILDELEIPRSVLAEIVPTSGILGYTDPEVFGARIPIASIVGDQQAAAFGQACLSEGMVKNTYGTGSFVVLNTGAKYIPPVAGLFSPVLWTIDGVATYGFEGLIDVSAAAIQWLRDGLGIIGDPAEAEVLAQQVDSTDGVYFVPAFVGLGAPYYDSYARGSIYGVTRGTTKQHLARATLEGMAYQVRDAFEIMQREAGLELMMMRADGGGAKSDFLMQFQADLLGVPVERPRITETTCLGAAYLAGLGVGFWESVDEIESFWQIEKRFEPAMSEDQRESLVFGWNRAIERSQGWLKDWRA
ncbi:glycerol kinase GlpK [Propionicicella superfundia]|uniref:glycerol kinase GlpK n=1 Tax=Propionicicella superfundia TaxID=348582 RepID=UPI00041D0D2B|nr:glycerol kinase GlpK [Propionicicella superfundia]